MTNKEILTPEFWIEKIKSNLAAWTSDECNCAVSKHSLALFRLHAAFNNPEVSFPLPPSWRDARVLYSEDGKVLDDALWVKLLENARCVLLPDTLPGFTIRLADLRRYPTHTCAFRTPQDREFDQFQETTLHTFEPILVIGSSQDGAWQYVVSTTYIGWMQTADVALCSEDEFFTFTHARAVCVVTGSGVSTQAQPYMDAVSRKPVEFAAVLPLCNESGHPIGNQSPIGNVRVLWPTRGADGKFSAEEAFVRKQTNLSIGYLSFTRETVIRMAFQLLAERYGWGGRLAQHDCSSFVLDVYRTMGIQLPRNAEDQEKVLPNAISIPETATAEERREMLCQFDAGDLLFMPGHVMLYLGRSDGNHYIIHDFSPMNQIMVTTVELTTQHGKSYLELLTGALTLFSRFDEPGYG